MTLEKLVQLGTRVIGAARIGAELIRHRPMAAPVIAAKCAIAKGVWSVEPDKFLMRGLHEEPVRRWAECLEYRTGLEPLLRMINWRDDAKRLTVDKLITAERLAERGIPAAPLIAVVGRDSGVHPHAGRFPLWSDVDAIAGGLASCPDRLFAKPATGWRGADIAGPERTGGQWTVSGETMSDRQFARHLLDAAPPAGTLLQERLRSHRGLAPIGGTLGLGTVRINTALAAEGPEIVFIFLKIMGSEGLVDNFSGGRFGNLLARVDAASGRITHVFGRKPDQRLLMEPVTQHPVTGNPMIGFQLPMWDEALALARRAAMAIPESPLIGADVAITDDGPQIIEMQSDWDANVAEVAIGGGLRPVLKEVIPRLALDDDPKRAAMEHIARSPRERRRAASARAPRL